MSTLTFYIFQRVLDFQILDQMKKVDKNESKPKVSEYLPRCGVTVDLYYPEQMSIDQLLEIFERRGFKSLVSELLCYVALYTISSKFPCLDSKHSFTTTIEYSSSY